MPFQTEAQLRASGFSKTPDALLGVPMGVLRRDGSPAVVQWIDSKATLGDPATFDDHLEQVSRRCFDDHLEQVSRPVRAAPTCKRSMHAFSRGACESRMRLQAAHRTYTPSPMARAILRAAHGVCEPLRAWPRGVLGRLRGRVSACGENPCCSPPPHSRTLCRIEAAAPREIVIAADLPSSWMLPGDATPRHIPPEHATQVLLARLAVAEAGEGSAPLTEGAVPVAEDDE